MLDITMIVKVRYSDEKKHEEDEIVRWICFVKLVKNEHDTFWRYFTRSGHLDMMEPSSLDKHVIDKMKNYSVINKSKNVRRHDSSIADFFFEESDLTDSTPFAEYIDNHGQLKY